jgi:hypothetical protein
MPEYSRLSNVYEFIILPVLKWSAILQRLPFIYYCPELVEKDCDLMSIQETDLIGTIWTCNVILYSICHHPTDAISADCITTNYLHITGLPVREKLFNAYSFSL